MANNARGQATKAKNSEMAARMKLLGIRRKTFQCPINHHHSHPVGYSFNGAMCR